MDISKFKGLAKGFDEGVEIEILHPKTNAKLGMFVTVASYQSERVKALQRTMTNALIREQKRNPKKVGTVEELEKKTMDIVSTAVLSWRGFEDGGKEIECSPENVLAVLENPDLWFIGEQIDKAADDQGAFIKA